MVDKNLFIQDLKQANTVLQELKIIENYIMNLIFDSNYVDTIKEYIIQNNNTTEIGGNVEIDGKLEVNSETNFNGTNTFNNDVNITGKLYLPSSNSLIIEDGSSLVNKAKLVARGTYNSEFSSNEWDINYSININLKPNTFYLARRYDGIMTIYRTVLIITDNTGSSNLNSIFATKTDGITPVLCSFNYYNDEKRFQISNEDDIPLFYSEEDDYIEVYELPFILI